MIIENIIESHRQNKHRDDEDNVQIIQKIEATEAISY